VAEKPQPQHNQRSVQALRRIGHETPEDRAALEGAVLSWLKQANEAKWPRVLQYFENASYLLGNHTTRYFFEHSRGFGIHQFGVHDQSRFDAMIAKVADNHLIRPVETVVGMLTDARLGPRVAPNEDTPESEDAATLSELYLNTVYEQPLNMPELLRDAAMIAIVCGTVIAETEFGDTGEPTEIPKYKTVKRKNAFHDPDDPDTGPPEMLAQEPDGFDVVSRRDLMVRMLTPMHVTADPTATSFRDINWISRTTFEDIEWIRENYTGDSKVYNEKNGYYPEALDNLREEDVTRHTLYWWTKFQDVLESPQYLTHGGGMAPSAFLNADGLAPGQTSFTMIDVRPSKQYPRGRTLVLAGGKLIYCSPKDVGARAWSAKYPHRWHPYSYFGWFKMPGRFWSVALLSELVPLQKKINAIDALVHANRQYMSIGQWLLPKHAKLAEGKISGLPGEHYTYIALPGLPAPEKVKNSPLPEELLVERMQLARSIDDLASSGLIDKDQVSASAARAGVMLDFLRSEKLRSKSPMLHSWESFIESISQNILIETQLNLIEEDPDLTARLMAAAAQHGKIAINNFVGASLRDHHVVKIDIASQLRHTPEAEAERAIEYLQYRQGNVSPAEVNAVLRAIRLDKYMKNEQDAAINRARRMISTIKAGRLDAFLPMEGVDDEVAMAPVFHRELLLPTFMEQPPEIQQVLLVAYDHYAGIAAQKVAAQRQQALQEAMMLKGGGGGGDKAQAA
jgi:hypothetical protein